MIKVAVIIMGFGEPYWNTKINILKNNINILNKYNPEYFISQYTMDKTIINTNIDTNIDINLNIIKKVGILGQLLVDNWHPDKFINYDYIILLLDDIELQDNFDLDYIINMKNKYNLNIVSPSLTKDSLYTHKIMKQTNDTYVLKETKFCELFCYIMDYETYKIYYEFTDRNNPWTWGMDTILCSIMKFRVGIFNNITMKHYFINKKKSSARTDMNKYLEKYNVPFKLDFDIIQTFND